MLFDQNRKRFSIKWSKSWAAFASHLIRFIVNPLQGLVVCMYRAAGTYEDMRTGPHHIFRIVGGKTRILLILTVITALNLSSENLKSKLYWYHFFQKTNKTSFLEEMRTQWRSYKYYIKASLAHDWNQSPTTRYQIVIFPRQLCVIFSRISKQITRYMLMLKSEGLNCSN